MEHLFQLLDISVALGLSAMGMYVLWKQTLAKDKAMEAIRKEKDGQISALAQQKDALVKDKDAVISTLQHEYASVLEKNGVVMSKVVALSERTIESQEKGRSDILLSLKELTSAVNDYSKEVIKMANRQITI